MTVETETATATVPAQVYHVFIKVSPERIWEAITKPEFTEQYFYGARIETKDGRRVARGPNDKLWADEQEPLILLCCCAPPYSDEDTILLED